MTGLLAEWYERCELEAQNPLPMTAVNTTIQRDVKTTNNLLPDLLQDFPCNLTKVQTRLFIIVNMITTRFMSMILWTEKRDVPDVIAVDIC